MKYTSAYQLWLKGLSKVNSNKPRQHPCGANSTGGRHTKCHELQHHASSQFKGRHKYSGGPQNVVTLAQTQKTVCTMTMPRGATRAKPSQRICTGGCLVDLCQVGQAPRPQNGGATSCNSNCRKLNAQIPTCKSC